MIVVVVALFVVAAILVVLFVVIVLLLFAFFASFARVRHQIRSIFACDSHSLPLPLLLSGYAERNVNLYKCCCCCRPATPTMTTTTTSSLPLLLLAALSVEGSFYNLKPFFFCEATTEAFVACLCCPC